MKKNILTVIFLLFSIGSNAEWMDVMQKSTIGVVNDIGETSNDIVNDLSKSTDDVLNQTGEFISGISDKVLTEIEDQSTILLAKIKKYTDETKKIGFYGSEVWITGKIPPTVSVSFEDRGKTGQEDKVLKDNEDSSVLTAILKFLISIRDFETTGYSLNKIVIKFDSFGMPVPQVRMDVVN